MKTDFVLARKKIISTWFCGCGELNLESLRRGSSVRSAGRNVRGEHFWC